MAQIATVEFLAGFGVVENKDIAAVLGPLSSHDKLRGVKRSITVIKNKNQKAKKKPEVKTVALAKIYVNPKVKAKPREKTATGENITSQDLKVSDLATARIRGYKAEIIRLCGREARKNIMANNMSMHDIESSGREVYREPFRTLYHEFDAVISRKLENTGMTLADYGLGFKLDKNAANYLEKVANAGFLTHMYTVAKNLYGSR